MSGDLLHSGHLNILKVARSYGNVVVGLATDELNANYKQLTHMDYAHRKVLIENIKGVQQVIPQPTMDLEENLRNIKPDFVVHGDDWKKGRLRPVRQRVIEVIAEWGGKLVEPAYTEGVSSTELRDKLLRQRRLPEQRIWQFRKMLMYQSRIRVLGVYDGLSAQVVEHTRVEKNGRFRSFDAMWLTNEAEAVAKGKFLPSFSDQTSRLQTIHQILDRTSKPLLVDLSSQNQTEIQQTINTFERIGVSAVLLNRQGNLQNSFQTVDTFCDFIAQTKAARLNQRFSIIVALQFGEISDALHKAQELIASGADAIFLEMSPSTNGSLFQFCDNFAALPHKVPLMVDPTNHPKMQEIIERETNLQLLMAYPSQLICRAFSSVQEEARLILENGRFSTPATSIEAINKFYQNE